MKLMLIVYNKIHVAGIVYKQILPSQSSFDVGSFAKRDAVNYLS